MNYKCLFSGPVDSVDGTAWLETCMAQIYVFQLRDCIGLKPYTRIAGLLRGRLAVYMLLNMKESTTWAEILRALY